jgi:pyruvate formate lyase activating enzyme
MFFGGFEKFTLIDYPGKTACMVYTTGCPFRCPYCHNPELVNNTCKIKIDEKEVLDFLSKRKNMLDGIVITGGEPSMHGEKLIEFMRKVKVLGFQIKLDTNGVDPKFLQKAIDEKLVDYIAMDIKAPVIKYMQSVGRSVDVDAIRKSIQIIKNSGVDYEFRTTIVRSMLSSQDLEQIGIEIAGAKRYFLQKFVPTKVLSPQFIKKSTYTDDEFIDIKSRLEKYVEFCGIR